jgi:SAM-dependent methyltransferase
MPGEEGCGGGVEEIGLITLPVTYTAGDGGVRGATAEEFDRFGPCDQVRLIERASIRTFMEKHRGLLRGRVLDFGAGLQPYRDLVEGEYVAFQEGERFPDGQFDAVMCNQVLQYVDDPAATIAWHLKGPLRPGGALVMTYATNWDFVEETDKWRFTYAGIARLLTTAGFLIVAHELRAAVKLGNFSFPLGYGVVALK